MAIMILRKQLLIPVLVVASFFGNDAKQFKREGFGDFSLSLPDERELSNHMQFKGENFLNRREVTEKNGNAREKNENMKRESDDQRELATKYERDIYADRELDENEERGAREDQEFAEYNERETSANQEFAENGERDAREEDQDFAENNERETSADHEFAENEERDATEDQEFAENNERETSADQALADTRELFSINEGINKLQSSVRRSDEPGDVLRDVFALQRNSLEELNQGFGRPATRHEENDVEKYTQNLLNARDVSYKSVVPMSNQFVQRVPAEQAPSPMKREVEYESAPLAYQNVPNAALRSGYVSQPPSTKNSIDGANENTKGLAELLTKITDLNNQVMPSGNTSGSDGGKGSGGVTNNLIFGDHNNNNNNNENPFWG